VKERSEMIKSSNTELSITKQCKLLGVSRSTYYYQPLSESPYNLALMDLIDKKYMDMPSYGSRSMTAYLRKQGHQVNRKRVSRLMRQMGIEALYPKPKKGTWRDSHKKFPYLLKNVNIGAQNHVWGSDITYIPVKDGYLYLVAVLDLYSRFVLSWKLSNNLESDFCIDALKESFNWGTPEIFNTDQGVQFTSKRFVECLEGKEIQVSMSGKGRCWDNIFVERFWRTLKYEEVYINYYVTFKEAEKHIHSYIEKYNNERLHSSLDYITPAEFYKAA